MFNLFRRRSPATTAPAFRTQLGLESLDRRDMPSSLLGTSAISGNEIQVRFPNIGGCWPGPAPVLGSSSIVVIGSADASADLGQKVFLTAGM